MFFLTLNQLNIVQHIKYSEDYWKLPFKTVYHHTISQIVTQKIRFEMSRKIRSNLYKLLGIHMIQIFLNNSQIIIF